MLANDFILSVGDDYQFQVLRAEFQDQVLPWTRLDSFECGPASELWKSSHRGVLKKNDDVVGLASLDVFEDPPEVVIQHLEIIRGFRGAKLNRTMVRGVFDYAEMLAQQLSKKAVVTAEGFTPDGEKHIRPTLEEVNSEYSDVDYT